MTMYTIEINGWGAEMALGTVTKEAYEFWGSKDEDDSGLHSHLFWDPYEAEDGNEVTDDEDPRFLGYWHELDDIEHTHGAFWDKCVVVVRDEDGNEIWETDEVEIKSAAGGGRAGGRGGGGIKTWSTEKGNFLSAEIETDKFDPSKLVFYATNVDADVVIDSVEYDGIDLDNDGGDTRGKSSGWEFYENF